MYPKREAEKESVMVVKFDDEMISSKKTTRRSVSSK